MTRELYVNADDFGLTRGINESILESIDHGAVNSVSILANGEDVAFALEALRKRHQVRAVIHFNLTEGPALGSYEEVAPLVDRRGAFRSSVGGLWMRYLLSTPKGREAIRQAVVAELRAQCAVIQGGIETRAIDGHQHVHMIPFVRDVILDQRFSRMRMPQEPLYLVPHTLATYVSMHAIGRLGLSLLSRRARSRCKERSVQTNDACLGILFSGAMRYEVVERGLRTIAAIDARSAEVIVHPGSARSGELNSWLGSRANIQWHFAPSRAAEREMLLQPKFAQLLNAFQDETLAPEPPVRLVQYVTTGALATGFVLGLLYVLTEWLHVWYVLSAAISLTLSVVLSFMLQKHWTFQDKRPVHVRQVTFFLGLNIFNIAANSFGLYVCVEFLHLWYLVAEILVAGVIAMWSFFVMRHGIFRQ